MERRSHSHKAVFTGLAISLALAFAFALYIHNRFANYQPRVVRHLPDEVRSALWLNVEQTVGFDAFAKYVLPLLEVGRTSAEPRVKHLERKTTLELEVDTREFAFARLTGGNWLVLLGGLYRRDDVAAGLLRLLEDEGVEARREQQLVVTARGEAFGVAEDGVLVIGSSVAVARSALSFQSEGPEWKALLEKPGTVLNIMAFGPEPRFSSHSIRGVGDMEAAQRWWLSLEPGNPFPLFVEGVGRSKTAALPGQLPFSPKGLKALSSPKGIAHFAAKVPQSDFDATFSAWNEATRLEIWAGRVSP